MALNLVNLDDRTRSFMLQEIERDIQADTFYNGKYLNPEGLSVYPSLLREAAEMHDDFWLAQQLIGKSKEKHEYPRQGKIVVASVPKNAHQVLAEGQFNRFYLRGLCLRAVEDGIEDLIFYRAKAVENPRPETEAKIDTTVSAKRLLKDLRSDPIVDTVFGLKPGSGLSARLP